MQDFAFIISLIREAIKDMEDMPGDSKYGCRTMPIAWGVNATKVYAAVWLVVLIALLSLVIQIYILQFKWWLPIIVYCMVTIIFPLVIVLVKLKQSCYNNRSLSPAQQHITKLIDVHRYSFYDLFSISTL